MQKITLPAVAGMVEVSEKAFFATVGQLAVSPRAEGRYDQTTGYVSKWKMHGGSGPTLGASFGGTHLCADTYMVTPEFFAANRAAFA